MENMSMDVLLGKCLTKEVNSDKTNDPEEQYLHKQNMTPQR